MRAIRFLLLNSLLVAAGTAAAPAAILAHLPDTAVTVAKVDSAGNIYIAGHKGTPGVSSTYDAFVTKLSPDGSKVLFSTSFAGGKFEDIVALDIDSSGAAYIAGQTQSPDFPVTAGALQSTFLSSSNQAFAAKIDAQGKVVYATFLGDTSAVIPFAGGLLVDSQGAAFISGQTNGSFPAPSGQPLTPRDNGLFILKLDPSGGKLLGAARGVGGRLATDALGNVYIAGSLYGGGLSLPLGPGAFQTTVQLHACAGTAQLGIGCSYQFAAKLTADLSQLLYSTYISGSWGAAPAAIAVDAQGNATLAGTTYSPDYPTTPDAFEPFYAANAPAPPQTCLFFCIFPPPATGYVTKLNATGTALIASTFFSGTQADTLAFAAFAGDRIYLSGQVSSGDLPGLDGVPPQCVAGQSQTFYTWIGADLKTISAAGLAPVGAVLAFDPGSSTLLEWTGSDLLRVDPAAARSPVACILDAADLRPVTSVAPGELLSIFGSRIADQTNSQPPGAGAAQLAGVTVTFNGTPAAPLYVSPQQINIQVPFEIAGASQASVVFTSRNINVTDSSTLPVSTRNPTIFLDTVTSRSDAGLGKCSVNGSLYNGGPLPLAFNSDGSRNTCANPAARGSSVTIFLAGLGLTTPRQTTGGLNTSPGIPLDLPVTLPSSPEIQPAASVVAAAALPGSISGVWRIQLRLSAHGQGAVPVSLLVDSVPVRDTNFTIWTR